jgi:hypothetical protein
VVILVIGNETDACANKHVFVYKEESSENWKHADSDKMEKISYSKSRKHGLFCTENINVLKLCLPNDALSPYPANVEYRVSS